MSQPIQLSVHQFTLILVLTFLFGGAAATGLIWIAGPPEDSLGSVSLQSGENQFTVRCHCGEELDYPPSYQPKFVPKSVPPSFESDPLKDPLEDEIITVPVVPEVWYNDCPPIAPGEERDRPCTRTKVTFL